MEVLLQQLIEEAIQRKSEDIYLMPLPHKYEISIRTNGFPSHFRYLKSEIADQLINHVKFKADMQVGERRKPQSGSMDLFIKEQTIPLRISTISNFKGQESMVIRLHLNFQLSKGAYVSDQHYQILKEWLLQKSGLLLFSGPVASGKTTTMYQLLDDRYRHIKSSVITMEDPVELIDSRYLQAEINPQAGISYDILIKSALRHHPDILLIGEVRDEETARMMIRAALTGHLVLATIHAKNTIGVLNRLIELGISKQQLIQSLLGVSSQRLIPLSESSHHSKQIKRAVLFELMTATEAKAYLLKQTPLKKEESFNGQLDQLLEEARISYETYQQFFLR
ncbi:general secretion pathway protein GspE [Atopobacter sp. AH10]|uniref:competence type IV pilus ATPase ComGA n=1 Tax=Atopobacter sp. AH10 TaxID=2315861 RepID=UPI000EF226CE|nr:competence type IV pilus ATPase ComGA [Atopobacter sp. AH10]RLK62532.1 general secretion pathway protein GspE [Atopobacter sp. AH10]